MIDDDVDDREEGMGVTIKVLELNLHFFWFIYKHHKNRFISHMLIV